MKNPCFASLVVCVSLAVVGPGRADDPAAHCRDLLDRAIKEMGGAAPLAKLQTATCKSKDRSFSFADDTVVFSMTTDWSLAGTDRYRADTVIEFSGRASQQTFIINSKKGWIKRVNQTIDFPKDYLPLYREGMYAARLVQMLPLLKAKPFELSPLGELKIGDRDAVGVRVIHKDHRDVGLYFDKKIGLPIKSEVRVTEMLGGDQEVVYEFYYSNYKDFDDLKQFSKVTFKRDGKRFIESELTELKTQEKLDASLFEKP